MTSHYFTYDKNKTIQALRYHFISRREIKLMMILVNVFAIAAAVLFYLKKISPFAFLGSSVLWFAMMIAFWYMLPRMVYKRGGATFKDTLRAVINEHEFRIENENAGRSWNWNEVSSWLETPHFFHIYFNPRSFFLVPKDAFTGEDEMAVRQMLKTKLG